MDLAPAWIYQKGGGGLNYGDHEWAKHGSCTSLDAEIFTSDSMGLTNSLPAPKDLVAGQGATTDLAALYRMYAFSYNATPGSTTGRLRSGGDGAVAAFACDEGGYLFGVTTCWSKGKDGRPTTRRSCPQIILESPYSNSCVNSTSILIRSGQPESIWALPGGILFLACSITVASLLVVLGIFSVAKLVIQKVNSVWEAKRKLDAYRKGKSSSRTALINYR